MPHHIIIHLTINNHLHLHSYKYIHHQTSITIIFLKIYNTSLKPNSYPFSVGNISTPLPSTEYMQYSFKLS